MPVFLLKLTLPLVVRQVVLLDGPDSSQGDLVHYHHDQDQELLGKNCYSHLPGLFVGGPYGAEHERVTQALMEALLPGSGDGPEKSCARSGSSTWSTLLQGATLEKIEGCISMMPRRSRTTPSAGFSSSLSAVALPQDKSFNDSLPDAAARPASAPC
ncbi:unnamed protein product [Amoebophrya sp. A25]|nr:unnamed protein product [Amoebophrya sp. A25]|eukprot:GSA25T00013938001.1